MTTAITFVCWRCDRPIEWRNLSGGRIHTSPCKECNAPAISAADFLMRRLFTQYENLHGAATDADRREFAANIEKLVTEGPEEKLPFKIVRSA